MSRARPASGLPIPVKALAGLLVAALVLVGTEAALMLAGVGARQPFFQQRSDWTGQRWMISNPKVGSNWFRSAEWEGMIRHPRFERFAADKDPRTLRIFVLGESAAFGTPMDENATWAAMLEALLNRGQDQRHVEVLNCAMRASDVAIVPGILEELHAYEPDLFLLYAAHNAFYGVSEPSWWADRRLSRLLGSLANRLRDPPAETERIGMRADYELAPRGMERAQVLARFRTDLDRVVRAAGPVPLALLDLPSNELDLAPLGSWVPAGQESLGARADQLVQQVERSPAQACQANAGQLEALLPSLPQHAGLHHALGICTLLQGDPFGARDLLADSIDLDSVPIRATAALRAATRDLPQRHPDRGLLVIDLEQPLREACTLGILGHRVFYDHVHLNPQGSYVAARQLARALAAQAGLPLDEGALPSLPKLQQELLFSPADEWIALSRMESFYRLATVRGSASRFRSLELFQDRKEELWAQLDETMRGAITLWNRGNGETHSLAAEAYSVLGDQENALLEARRAVFTRRAVPETHFAVAKLLEDLGRPQEARQELLLTLLYGGRSPDVLRMAQRLGLESP